MNKQEFHIKSYEDLLAEKQRLRDHFRDKKMQIREEVAALKDSLNPLKGIMKQVGKFTSPDKSMGLLNTGLGFTMDLLLRKFILKKSNWLVKLAAPFFIKNILSHFAATKIKTNMPEAGPVISNISKTAKI